MAYSFALSVLAATATLLPGSLAGTCAKKPVATTTCAGQTYVYEELAGVGILPGNSRDKYGDTIGGIGSAIFIDPKTWTLDKDGKYTGALWGLPDRGWNTEGSVNYQSRVHKFQITFTPNSSATATNPSGLNLIVDYKDTILFTGPDGKPCSGLDANTILRYPGFPDLPAAQYTGDGWGGAGPGDTRIVLDSEGLVLNDDGSFWISDEYGPYVYLFSSQGKMLTAIRPPDAIVPMRNGSESFSADSPPLYLGGTGDDISPADPDTGRENNHGFEGLGVVGNSLWVLLQAATVQEGGAKSKNELYTRLLKYDISNKAAPSYLEEYVVPLPQYEDINDDNSTKTAAQSEMRALPNGQFLVLARDSGAGHGQSVSQSVYRHIDVFDIKGATNIKGTYDCTTSSCAVASTKGNLNAGITVATYCPWLDFNVNAQLNRFGMHNGGAQDAQLLNEKWESISIVPVDPSKDTGEYFIFSLSDDDFITQDGFMNFGKYTYADASGYNLDNQALVFRVKLPY